VKCRYTLNEIEAHGTVELLPLEHTCLPHLAIPLKYGGYTCVNTPDFK
jgi:hypothetical protein